MNKWKEELERYLNEEDISDLYDKNLIKEMLEFEGKNTTFGDSAMFKSRSVGCSIRPAISELELKKECINELTEVNAGLYNDIKELGEEIQSQDKQLSGVLQDWHNNKLELDEQTKEVKRLKDKIELMSTLNNELQEENLRLKDKGIYDPYLLFCTTNIKVYK
jgi:dynactin complex subunit